MNNKQLIFSYIVLTVFLLSNQQLCCQIMGFEKIDESKVNPWLPKLTIEYQAVYHFGDSEMESEFVLIFTGNDYVGQIKSGSWSDDGKSWVWNYKNLTNIKLYENHFYSDETDGEFVFYQQGDQRIKGLKIYKPWSGLAEEGEYEIGPRNGLIKNYFNGKFPQASKRLLVKEELKEFSKSDLKIMRNEIFARYGFKFKDGGEMQKYFKNQSWYAPQHINVNSFLTSIEKENIKTIKLLENE